MIVLHLLWIVLRILLTILGILLGLILLALLLVLFCPVRYQASVKKETKEFRETTGLVSVSWLFRGIHLLVPVQKGKIHPDIHLFGISLKKVRVFLKRRKKGKEQADRPIASDAGREQENKAVDSGAGREQENKAVDSGAGREQENEATISNVGREQEIESAQESVTSLLDQDEDRFDETDAAQEKNDGSGESEKTESGKPERVEPDGEKPECAEAESGKPERVEPDGEKTECAEAESGKPENEEPENEEPECEKTKSKKKFEIKKSWKKKKREIHKKTGKNKKPGNNKSTSGQGSLIGRLLDRVDTFFEKLGEKTENLEKKKDALERKLQYWSDFLGQPRVKSAISLSWSKIMLLIRHVLPVRMSGDLYFGFSDPAITGWILMIMGMTIPLHKNSVTLHPDFEGENHIEGTLLLKGRIYGIVFAAAALRILLDKNIRYVYRRLKKKEE